VIQLFRNKIIPIFLIPMTLLSCDGSAPGGNAIIPDNNLPVFTSASVVSVVENTTAVVTVQVLDADGDTIAYSITGGNDQAAFSIDPSTGDLAFLTAPDYETPGAAGGGNSYVLVITADDDLSVVEQNILVSVTNADDNPPVASDLIVFDNNAGALVEGDTLVSNYVYSDADGDTEGVTTIRWLRDGVEISGETASTYVVTAADVGEPVSFEITPVSTNGAAGTPVVSPTITTTNNAPLATSVIITGDSNGVAKLGDTLTGTYIYSDFENDIEGPTAFRWLRDGSPIAGVTVTSYTLVAADVGSVIRFEVTPFSNSGTSPGAVVLSAAVSVPNNAPTASPVTLAGNPYTGQILSGAYTYSDVEGDLDAGASTFRWLRNGVEIFGETLSTYLLQLVDVGTEIKFEVIPKSLTGVSPGVAVTSDGLQILNEAPTVASADIRFLNNLSNPVLLASYGDVLTGDYPFVDLEGDLERVSGSIYQWYRGGVAITGATEQTYTLGADDVNNSRLTLEVTPIARSGTVEGLPSVSTTFVTVVNEEPVVSNVTVSGATAGFAGDGFVLTGSYDYSDLESNPDTSTFRWLRADDSAISGQVSQNYTVQAAELGEVVRLEVTPASSVGNTPGLAVVSAGISLNAVPVASPTISVSPAGAAVVGSVLTGSDGYTDAEGDTQGASIYSWLRDEGGTVTIISSGTTNSPYTVTTADSGAVIRFEVLPKASGGTSPGITAVSADVSIINVVPVSSPPNITGVLNVGEVLTGNYSYSDFDGDAQGLSGFRWLRDGVEISGETSVTYTLVAADAGTDITFEVTPVALSGLSPGLAVISSAVSINELPVANTIVVTGTATVGQMLSASYVYSDAEDAQGTSTFRWLRNGLAISGATTTNYTVALEDVGELIQFEVTPIGVSGSNPGFAVLSTGVTPTNVFASNVVCTTNENGIANKLGVSRFWRFTATQTQAITIQANQTSGTISASTANPDLYLYKQGVLVAQETADTSTSQTMITGVTAGDYVLELKEVYYATNAAPVSTACYDVSIAYGGGFAKPGAAVEKAAGSSVVAKSGPSSCSAVSEINVSGTVSYERVPHNAGTSGLDYASVASSPIKGAVVEVICGAEGFVYDSGVTDASGAYSLKASNSVDNYVRVKAQLLDATAPGTWNFKVVDNTSGGALYVMDTTPFNSAVDVTANDFTALSGWGGAAYTGPRVAAPFAILDSVYDSFQTVLAVDGNAVFPALNINWSTLNAAVGGDKALGQISTSHYDPATGEIYILGDEDSDTDEYDKHVIIHEWAHYFEDKLSRTDSIGGAHNINDTLDMRLAFGEGFGNAYAGIVSADPVYRDSSGVGQLSGFDFDMDIDVCVNPGWFSECSVHELLYDFSVTTFAGDFTPLYNVLINEQKNTSAFTSIFSFVWELKDNNAAQAGAIDTLVTGQSIDVITDIYGDSEATNNPGTTDELPIYEQF